MSKEIQRWADDFMFTAEKSDASKGPEVYLLGSSSDPLGQIAACAKMYKGEVVRDLADVTDEERREYLAEMQKTKLKMPLEAVSLHFMIEGVTRGFTHQMVRQRTAAYAQESTRFAVKEDLNTATAIPPHLAGTRSLEEWYSDEGIPPGDGNRWSDVKRHGEFHRANERQQQRLLWDQEVNRISETYMRLVDSGMPAEDARGLMPTNITTRLNYITNLRGLLDHAGNRLCTQAQFEWRLVFAQIAQAMRAYGQTVKYAVRSGSSGAAVMEPSAWQWDAIADLLAPVCYQTGKCEFKADFDRKCSIRGRVDDNAALGRPSSEWDIVANLTMPDGTNRVVLPIQPREWLADPAAAR